ncbi:hypothetical protein MMC28_004577 [Mycoblastus sanguinarius]|nr:hypothetical protein [Mycoblastus sanguinarius]
MSDTLKRKYSELSTSEAVDVHEESCSGSVTIDIDPDGDLYMELKAGSLKVSQKVLSISSKVFHAMLGNGSRFKESVEKTLAPDGIQIVAFPDDDFETMVIIARIMHLQSNKVPTEMTFRLLYQVAVLCDKYDLLNCLGPWPKMWATPYLDSYRLKGYEGWLFISIVFKFAGLYKEVTRHLILNTEISAAGVLVSKTGVSIGEHVSSAVLGKSPACLRIVGRLTADNARADQLIKARANTMFVVMDLYWQEFCKLRFSNKKRVCKVGSKAALCDAINLGCLYQRMSTLSDPRVSICQSTVDCIVTLSEKVMDVSTWGIKFGDHRTCDVGSRLTSEAKKLSSSVQGLDMST